MNRSWRRVILVLVTLLVCVGCDQRTKALARGSLREREAKSILDDTVRLDYAEKPDGFLGLGDSLPTPWRAAIFSLGCSYGIAACLYIALFATHPRKVEIR